MQAQENNEIVALSDNQMLRSLRKIKGAVIDENYLSGLFGQKDKIKKLPTTNDNIEKLRQINDQIIDILFVPEYITIVIEHPSHYKYLFHNGLQLKVGNNEKKIYRRFSCSASQARNSTVVFVEEEVGKELKHVLNNGRDPNKKLTPSKFNAYFGVAGSGTKVVSSPRFCVVPDYKSKTTFKANFVTETDWQEDDNIEEKMVTENFNRFDGMGLISPEKSAQWAYELGLDYVPAQWCVRQNFLKGLLCTFPIHEFCEDENDMNYYIKSIYKDENGNNKVVDLRNCDVIISESMFKLWDSFESVEAYEKNCEENDLKWGVALYTPKEDKDILTMNYQFLQTLHLEKRDIEKLCQKFVDWISGVSVDNIYYTLLFLLGKNTTEEKIKNYLKNSENHWVRSLLINNDLIKDKYIREKIYDLIKKKIKKGCLGEIITDGNFQTIVSDPYAMMQHVCGHEVVNGLLGEKEYYSNYWNNKEVKVVDSMRSPLTYRSEHLKLNLVNDDKKAHWYRYCTTGIIVNVHGSETVNWSGSDFDFDILATTSNSTIIKSIYEDELPVMYEPPKPTPVELTDELLYEADLFAFGSIIGSITNKSTSGYALLPLFDKNSEEYKVLMNRIRMCTKLQNAQIDKAKIGKKVKGIPKRWVDYQKTEDGLSEEDRDFYNRINMKKHPYFFIYLYKDTKRAYQKCYEENNVTCKQLFKMSLKDLMKKDRKTLKEKEFIVTYKNKLPVIDTDCVMNNLCKYIESIDFSIRQKVKDQDDSKIYRLYMDSAITGNKYEEIKEIINQFNKEVKNLGNSNSYEESDSSQYSEDTEKSINNLYASLKIRLERICSNESELANYLVEYFYVDKIGSNKDLLWNICGNVIFENIKKNTGITTSLVPLPDDSGDINYLNKKYSLCEVKI